MTQVIFVLSQQMLATSVSWPADMFSAANEAAKTLCPNAPPFMFRTTAIDSKQINNQTPFSVKPEQALDQINHADLIYLPALWRNPNPILRNSHSLYPWLRQHYENGSIISAVGTGCCFMAEAGLLDHKPATTHWYYFDQFQKRYPQIHLKRQHFITQAGNLYCTASINSLADLTIHFIQQFMNKAVARHVERHFSHEIRRAYEHVSYFEDGNINHSDEEILQVQLWLKNNLNKNISIHQVASQFGMSSRNFNRRFKEATGKTPLNYIHESRINVACDLLQSSNLSIGDIAEKVGYNDISYFTQSFKKKRHITPREYRTTVRAKLFHHTES